MAHSGANGEMPLLPGRALHVVLSRFGVGDLGVVQEE